MATRLDWKLPPGFKAGEIEWPLPKTINEEGDLQTYAYESEVLLLVEITPPKQISEREVKLGAGVSWLVCHEICVPGEAEVSLILPVGDTAAPANEELFTRFKAQAPSRQRPPFTLSWENRGNELVLNVDGVRPGQTLEFYPDPPDGVSIGRPTVAQSTVSIPLKTGAVSSLPGVLAVAEGEARLGWRIGEPDRAAAREKAPGSVWHFLTLGFLGGFILNLMPCVLPVIALKIFGFIQQAGQSRERIWKMGLAFVAGIFAWFLGLAALISVLRAAGHELNWSFQFQHPGFLVGMMVVILVFALNLLGVFEITLPGSASTTLIEVSSREGYGGTFLHGVFATLMATPCTAPFLGPALGFAFAQSPAIIFAMFSSIAAGMSLPYLLLSARPAWIKFLPKPGLWMVRVKQAMGVLLVGTFLWLAWVLWQQQTTRRQPFTPQLEKALASGRTVFIDFTADWCVNCKVNERLVLDTEPVQRALREHGVLFLKADWTNGDADITNLLRSFGRAGVPLYVIYPKGDRDRAIVLPELITQKTVLDALQQANQ